MWNQRLVQLTKTDLREKVVQFHDDGLTATAIAKRLGVSSSTISRILKEQKPSVSRTGWGRRIGYREL
jgi:IS30 family transposase